MHRDSPPASDLRKLRRRRWQRQTQRWVRRLTVLQYTSGAARQRYKQQWVRSQTELQYTSGAERRRCVSANCNYNQSIDKTCRNVYLLRESVAALLDVLHQQVVDWFARLDARHHHPTRSVLSKPCALLSLCEELREDNDGRAFRRSIEKGLVQGTLRLLRWAYYRTQAVPQQDDVHATAGATSTARDGQCIPTTKFISPCVCYAI